MTTEQKNKIVELRNCSVGYIKIAQIMGIPVNSVKSYCRRHGMTAKETADVLACPNCGKRIINKPKHNPRRFCSDTCRLSWWKKHPESKSRKTFYKFVCKYCGTAFESYGNSHRKYCSHACYIADRYNTEHSHE